MSDKRAPLPIVEDRDDLGQARQPQGRAPAEAPPNVPSGSPYVSAACRIGGHRLCQERCFIRCGCDCHGGISGVRWRKDNQITVTHRTGEVEVRRGSWLAASALAKESGLSSVSRAAVEGQEWARRVSKK